MKSANFSLPHILKHNMLQISQNTIHTETCFSSYIQTDHSEKQQ